VLQKLSSVRLFVVLADVFQMLVGLLIVCRLQYCSAALAGIPINLPHQFQSGMNTTASNVVFFNHQLVARWLSLALGQLQQH
jgi:hypothetical protein